MSSGYFVVILSGEIIRSTLILSVSHNHINRNNHSNQRPFKLFVMKIHKYRRSNYHQSMAFLYRFIFTLLIFCALISFVFMTIYY